MKKKTIFALVSMMIFLLGCAPASSVATEMPSMFTPPPGAPASLSPSLSTTMAPVASPTEAPTPTIALMPTETGPKEGDQMTDNGYTYMYSTPENGFPGFYRPAGQISFYPWAFATIPDGHGGRIPATASNDIGPTTIMIEYGVNGDQAIQALTQAELQKGINPTPMYIDDITTDLQDRVGISTSNQAVDAFNSDLQTGNVSIHDTVFGHKLDWPISRTSGATIWIVKNDTTKLTKENGFWKWTTPGGVNFWTAYWGVNEKGLNVGMSTDTALNALSPDNVRLMILGPEAAAIDTTDLTNTNLSIVHLTQSLVNDSASGPSAITIQPRK